MGNGARLYAAGQTVLDQLSSPSWVAAFPKKQHAAATCSCTAPGPQLVCIKHVRGRSDLPALVCVNIL